MATHKYMIRICDYTTGVALLYHDLCYTYVYKGMVKGW